MLVIRSWVMSLLTALTQSQDLEECQLSQIKENKYIAETLTAIVTFCVYYLEENKERLGLEEILLGCGLNGVICQ